MGEVVHVRDGVEGAVYIGRPSLFGNPFVIGKDGNRETVVVKYREYAISRAYWDREFREAVVALKGKTLACWCGEKVCHGDVLMELAERLGQ
jgi:hypothetical protein